jgi:xylose isomerase
MTPEPQYGAGLWHFAQYVDRYATDGYGPPVTTLEAIEKAGQVGDLAVVDITYPFNPPGLPVSQVAAALKRNDLRAIGITPEIYTREFCRGAFTNADPAVRARAIELVNQAADVARELECDYVKLWPGQDGHDYPFQVDHGQIWSHAVTGLRSLAQGRPEMRFAIEYKPREPRVSMFFSSAAKTLLAIEDMDAGNVGILLDFGHSLYGGESPAEAARLIHSRGLLYGIDVNDNFRGWDDDLVVGSVHLTETLEFFYTLRECGWEGVWQLDQFPFREDSVEAAREGIETMRSIHRALDLLDVAALRDAQARQDALAANKIVRQALLSCEPKTAGR